MSSLSNGSLTRRSCEDDDNDDDNDYDDNDDNDDNNDDNDNNDNNDDSRSNLQCALFYDLSVKRLAAFAIVVEPSVSYISQ